MSTNDYNVAIYLPDVDEDGLTVVDIRTLPAAKVAALRAVQELLGHASIATTQLYVQVDAEALHSAASAAWGLAA